MLREKSLLMIPGPTPIPPQVAAAMTQPMINHRGEAFSDLFDEVAVGLKQVFRTEQPVYVFPGAGSGGWEAALVNTLNPGDTVLSVSVGDFGERWFKVATKLGLAVERLRFEPGQAADPARIAERLADDREKRIKAVLIQHNETSTGVTNDVEAIARVVREHGALIMVDAVSGLGALPLEMDRWDLDVVLTGAHKALMCPPGLSIVAFSERARAASEQNTMPRFYWDLKAVHSSYLKRQTPYTPAISLFYALQAALRLIQAETLEGAWARHRVMGAMCRAGVRAMGLQLLAQDEARASNAVTAVVSPVDPKQLRKVARERLGVQLAGGQAELADKIFRIGHLGYVVPGDVLQALAATEMALAVLGQDVQIGRAVAAAQEVWMRELRG
ncbi:aspartate aminotransferase-like enzyme [Symbiobacterium terraclitae]|uniref:Aspartate aminotransferase-like enzyme n=1 Tax=Symbiobacterium terraclitae TaxID=557451 RepID=A0ABS4JVE6_9FIRM|nr:alanine--glyoxylate aminotransferase family protein [Symbiobacterium terraclitae]MBP2019510.1 aspartate aminotransferase-like enzyme [Symbiobacterium terraclitae]